MSTTDTPSVSPNPATAAPAPRSRLRRFVVGSALVLSGVIIGVGSSAISQGYGPHGGWSEGGPGWHMSGPQGWQGMQGGPGPGWGHHGPGFGHGPRFGGPMMFGPGRVERMVDRLGWAADASTEQKQKITGIVQRAADDVLALRDKHLAARKQLADILAAPTIDRGKLEALRTEQLKLVDEASKRIAIALADAGEVLTPAQRADLAKRFERFAAWRRG